MRRVGTSGVGGRLARVGAAAAVLGGVFAFGLAAPTSAASGSTPTPVSQASTSSRGVTDDAINVVFPIISFSSIEGEYEIESDAEYGEQTKAIHLFVDQVNDAGGINGRKINPMIVAFDPTNPAQQRSLCKQWTQGSPPVFAVLDGLGTWEGVNELCVTKEGHTPMLSQWTTTTNWTDLGAPYLWWTGADDAPILAATVNWGRSSGRLGHGTKVGVVVSDEVSDQDALNSSLLPDLKKIGVVPQVVT
ncbi:MAG TPA: ABC transporter substrate-binding protein, partial [Acidimicrobiales bacterium]|nr:ABC transporter substrate-binding protein [Acidimicrobiales bacterium]